MSAHMRDCIRLAWCFQRALTSAFTPPLPLKQDPPAGNGSLPPLTSPPAAMPDFPIEIDDSAFDSFGPLTFGLGVGLSSSSGALEAADTAHPNDGDKDAETDITETADLLGASASGADEFLSIRTPPPPAREAEPPAPETPLFSADDPEPVLVPAPSATPPLAPQTPATDEDAISFQFGQLSFGGNTPTPAVGGVTGAAALADSDVPQPSSMSAQEPGS